MKKVVIRSGSLRMGGLERVLIEVLQNMDLKKYEIYLFIEDDSGKDNIFLKDIPKNIKVYFLKPEKLMRKTESYKNRKKNLFYKLMYNFMMEYERRTIFKNTLRYLKEIGSIDVFIDYDWGATKYIEKLPVKKRIVWIHSSIPRLFSNRESKIKRFGKRLEKYDKIVAICDEMKNEIIEIYPQLKEKVTRIYNPFNFERIEKLGEEKSHLTDEELEFINEKYCVAVSRLDNVSKDYPTLLKAFQELSRKVDELKLFIVGDGPSREEIEQLAIELGIEKRVRFLGLQKNPYVWMKNSKFFVHSSKFEGFGLVSVEAMILGKIVISSDCPVGPKEVLENGKSGILYPVGDYKILAQEMENVFYQDERYETMRLRAQKRKLDFEKKQVMKEYEKIMEGEQNK